MFNQLGILRYLPGTRCAYDACQRLHFSFHFREKSRREILAIRGYNFLLGGCTEALQGRRDERKYLWLSMGLTSSGFYARGYDRYLVLLIWLQSTQLAYVIAGCDNSCSASSRVWEHCRMIFKLKTTGFSFFTLLLTVLHKKFGGSLCKCLRDR